MKELYWKFFVKPKKTGFENFKILVKTKKNNKGYIFDLVYDIWTIRSTKLTPCGKKINRRNKS